MDREALDTLRARLNELAINNAGHLKPLRFFTADECRRNPALAALAEVIEEAGLLTLGEAVAREDALASLGCPRCIFEAAIAEVVYAGEHIQQHSPGQLSDGEVRLVGLATEWLTDTAVQRCLGGPDTP